MQAILLHITEIAWQITDQAEREERERDKQRERQTQKETDRKRDRHTEIVGETERER